MREGEKKTIRKKNIEPSFGNINEGDKKNYLTNFWKS